MPRVEIRLNGEWVPGWRIRQGARNSRVRWGGENMDEREDLFPNDSVREPQDAVQAAQFDFSRIVPVTPLRSLYRYLRSVSGGRVAHFAAVEERLGPVAGLEPEQFLGHIINISVHRFATYHNQEPFVPEGANRLAFGNGSHFARQLAERWPHNGDGLAGMQFVDYEVSPYRTTRSCFEDGVSASRSGQGGVDLLLSRDRQAVVGEIKASTETVGSTFALIQALTYAVELATDAQRARLMRHYEDRFPDRPSIGIAILLESADSLVDGDLEMTQDLATKLMQLEDVTKHLARISVVQLDLTTDPIAVNQICDAH